MNSLLLMPLLGLEFSVVPTQPQPNQWTQIYGCTSGTNPNGFSLPLSTIQVLANQATQILITRNDGTFVISQPNTYPIQQLRALQTISFPSSGYATPTIISQTWTGSAADLGSLWNSCGAANSLSGSDARLYWACNNGGGLHLIPGQYCEWNWGAGYNGPISVYVNAVWTQIYGCSGATTGGYTLPLATIAQLAQEATQVLITFPDGTTAISTPNSYPIIQLRAGQTISYPLDNLYASTNIISRAWTGPAATLAHLWNSCGAPAAISSASNLFFWACNNGGGLHLQPNTLCRYNWGLGYTGPISVYINSAWTQIYSCSGNSANNGYTLPLSQIQSLANSASQVLVSLYDGTNIVSNPNSYPIQRLRALQTISYPPSGYASTDIIAANWNGPASSLAHLWNSCGAPADLNSGGILYWACNNGGGLHLQPNDYCLYTWGSGYTGPISVYINAVSEYSPGTFLENNASSINRKNQGGNPLLPM